MLAPITPLAAETERLAAVQRAELLDTPPEEVFDRLMQLAAEMLHVPLAVVSLVDANREFFKSAVGLPLGWKERRETPRGQSLAQIALMAKAPLAIEDARKDPLVKDNPLVPEWGVGSYAAVPIRTQSGLALGSVYVADNVPRVWTNSEIITLSTIAKAAETEIALRLALKDGERARAAMQTMLERVPYAIFTIDRDWRITFVNEKAESLLQASKAALLGNSVWGTCQHLNGTELESHLRRALSSPHGTSFEGYFAPAGAWYEASADPTEEGLTVFFKDVSARRRVEDTLRESERRYRFVFEEGLTCNTVTAPDGKMIACNQTFVSTYGFTSKEQALAAHADTLWREAGQRKEMLETLRKRGRFGPVEVRTKRQNNTFLDMMVTAVARFEKGELAEIHSCMLDITEQRQLEKQYRQSQKMEAVGQLAGGMAHDFNNLLTVIKAYVQLALAELAPEATGRADLKIIGDAADRAAELTRQLLAFSRQQVLQPTRLDLHAVITNMLPMLRAMLGPETQLIEKFTSAIPNVEADRSQIEQVLMNLVVNARDAMPSGGSITLSTGELIVTPLSADANDGAAPGSYVTLAIRDSGSGMSRETAAHIFEPFFTTKAPGKGTGLGLSTVYGIVKQSGGHIDVASVPGLGTTFTIMLPVASSPEQTGNKSLASASS